MWYAAEDRSILNNGYTRDYGFYERKSNDSYNRRCIDGKITGCSNCVGYCQYAGHSGFLTEELRQAHQCAEKNCRYFLPKPRKERTKIPADSRQMEVEHLAADLCAEYEGMRITRVVRSRENSWIAKYVSITNAYSIESIEHKLQNSIGETIKLVAINCDYDTAAEIIFSM